ncbi:hypothetical protein M408DRAFT_174435 [Serendipita vermifera MAFF 305830]|uniref:Essential protein Yae1 N-terminal domain-containing protein n=1 Tax=Serendipita vermifera MAFF 305830 TaxID=933852 RepID=A0A0C2VZX2_SERVB|nr:hypothetical protein M408DRAFT_174435 [Serendipita vermifera MAFF 305830]
MDIDLGDLVDLEQQFYDVGYKEGTEHGRVHGLIEGRALGKEKGFEMWEEVGFYLGFATTWKSLLEREQEPNSKLVSHLSHLMELAGSFPMYNPSRGSSDIHETSPTPEIDIAGLLSRMRGRYRVACSGLGVRPRLPSSSVIDAPASSIVEGEPEIPVAESNSGPGNNSIWSFADASKKAGAGGLAF